jgi:UDP-N-acetylmuramoylalanine--D-glutamate ligase
VSWWGGRGVCVTGLGVSGPPVARALAARGARVTIVDAAEDEQRRNRAAELEPLGVTVLLGPGSGAGTGTLPPGTDIVVTSPGWKPSSPLLTTAAAAGIPVIGDVELAWRLRPELPGDGTGSRRQAWLAVTGTNGKTTTVRMLAAMLAAAGRSAIAAGNVGTPLLDVVTAGEPYEVLAVELSSFQLHWSSTVRPFAATVLNVAGHHLDWHGGIEAYAHDKGRIFAPGTVAVHNADDPWSRRLAAQARLRAAGAAAFTLGPPGPGQLGVEDGVLVDRAFGAGRPAAPAPGEPSPGEPARGKSAEPLVLASVADVVPAAPHNVADALAAAALARAYGVAPAAVADGLRAFQPDPHRISHVARIGGVDYVDDSKATNPHAAAASLRAFGSVVWVAGGLFRGLPADLDELARSAAGRLRAAVLLGTDREVFRQALERHAPDVPVVEVPGTDTGVMDNVVTGAAALARPGDTVLLAPATQSFDLFANYPARGDAFAAAVTKLAGAPPAGPGGAAGGSAGAAAGTGPSTDANGG